MNKLPAYKKIQFAPATDFSFIKQEWKRKTVCINYLKDNPKRRILITKIRKGDCIDGRYIADCSQLMMIRNASDLNKIEIFASKSGHFIGGSDTILATPPGGLKSSSHRSYEQLVADTITKCWDHSCVYYTKKDAADS